MGDDAEFAAWVQPHLLAMTRLAVRLAPNGESEDVVQEALVRAWQRWDTYRPDRGTPRAWLLAVVADKARRARRLKPRTGLATPSAPTADVEADLDLERAVRRLPDRQRLAVELYYFLDLDVRESAAVMGCAEGTVKSTLSDARARLGRLLQEVAQ